MKRMREWKVRLEQVVHLNLKSQAVFVCEFVLYNYSNIQSFDGMFYNCVLVGACGGGDENDDDDTDDDDDDDDDEKQGKSSFSRCFCLCNLCVTTMTTTTTTTMTTMMRNTEPPESAAEGSSSSARRSTYPGSALVNICPGRMAPWPAITQGTSG